MQTMVKDAWATPHVGAVDSLMYDKYHKVCDLVQSDLIWCKQTDLMVLLLTVVGQVLNAGGNNCRLVSWGHGTVEVGDQLGHMQGSSIWSSNWSSNIWGSNWSLNNWSSSIWDGWGSNWSRSVWDGWGGNGNRSNSSLGGKVLGPGGNNCGLISWDDSTVGVGHQVSSIWVATCVAMGGQVLSAGGDNCGLVGWDNSTVGVGNQLGNVQGSSIWSSKWSGNWSSNWSSNYLSSIWDSWDSNWSLDNWSSNWNGTLGGKVLGPGSDNCRLVSWDDSTVGVANQLRNVKLSGSHSGRGEESQQLHV